MIKLLLKLISRTILRKKKLLLILIVLCGFYKILKDSLSFSSEICTNNEPNIGESTRLNIYESTRHKVLCYLEFDKNDFLLNRLQLKDVFITVRHSTKHAISEIKYVYETWYQFAKQQVS